MKKKLIIQQMKPLSIVFLICCLIPIMIGIIYDIVNQRYSVDDIKNTIEGCLAMMIGFIFLEIIVLLHFIFNCVLLISEQEKLLGVNFEEDMKNTVVVKSYLANILMSREWIVINAVGYNRKYIKKIEPIGKTHTRNNPDCYSVKIYTINGKKKRFNSMFRNVTDLFYNWYVDYELVLKEME